MTLKASVLSEIDLLTPTSLPMGDPRRVVSSGLTGSQE